jgi:hypothetical protein
LLYMCVKVFVAVRETFDWQKELEREKSRERNRER